MRAQPRRRAWRSACRAPSASASPAGLQRHQDADLAEARRQRAMHVGWRPRRCSTDRPVARRRFMFSPMVAISVTCSSNCWPVTRIGRRQDGIHVAVRVHADRWRLRTNAWKVSLRATKSVSALTSTTAPRLPFRRPRRPGPSAATRPAFFAAAARPLVRSQSTASSISPSVSLSAFLQSIMPAPVLSRSSFTIAAVIAAMLVTPFGSVLRRSGGPPTFISFLGLLHLSSRSMRPCKNGSAISAPPSASVGSGRFRLSVFLEAGPPSAFRSLLAGLLQGAMSSGGERRRSSAVVMSAGASALRRRLQRPLRSASDRPRSAAFSVALPWIGLAGAQLPQPPGRQPGLRRRQASRRFLHGRLSPTSTPDAHQLLLQAVEDGASTTRSQ